ncbi:MAG: sulfotransferase, partial [Cyanobacteria bacterium P01_F01_bin.86]
RSGTTLLQQMLDAHPDIAIAPETHFMRLFWGSREHYGDLTEDKNYQQLIEDIIALPEFSEMELDSQVFSTFAWQVERSYAAIFQLLLKEFASHHNVTVVGEKTPNHVLYMPEIQGLFPDARFVHIVRDPRSVVNSWRSVPWSTGSVVEDAEMWRYYVSATQRKPPKGPGKVFTLHYEKLVIAPEESLRSLCQFIDLAFDPVMLNYYEKNSTLVNIEREPWKKNAVKPVTQASLSKWQRTLSVADIAAIEGKTWFEMQRYGYQPQTSLFQLLPGLAKTTLERRLKRFVNSVKYKAQKVTQS